MTLLVTLFWHVQIAPEATYESIRFTWIREQLYDYSCGASVVSSLAAIYWGIEADEDDLLQRSAITSGSVQKISLLDLAEMLGALGFAVRGFSMDYYGLLKAVARYGPLVVHLNEGDGHFVLVLGTVGGQPIVGDPSDGTAIWPAAAFVRHWSGVALVVTHSLATIDTVKLDELQKAATEQYRILARWGAR